MGKKRNMESGDDSGTWMNTYSDMVTLLLTFFVVLLSMSTVNEEKFNALIQSLNMTPQEVIDEITPINQSGMNNEEAEGTEQVQPEKTMDELYKYLKEYIEANGKGNEVEISKVDEVVYIRFSSNIFFEPDKSVLRQESFPTLEFMATGLKLYEDEIKMINICGYTATAQGAYGSNVSEWMLSGERAARVAIYLEQQKEFDGTKLVLIGYGQNYPVADNATEEGRRKNRRVELVVVGKDSGFDLDIHEALNGAYNDGMYPTVGGVNDVLIPPDESSKPAASSTPEASSSPDAAPESSQPPQSSSQASVTGPKPLDISGPDISGLQESHVSPYE